MSLRQEALFELLSWVLAEGAFFPQVPAWEGQDAGTAVFVRGGAPATPRPLVVPGSLISAVDVLGIGGAVTVVSVHVDTKDQKKNLQALVDVLSPFAGTPVIIGGDFNACRHWDTVRGSNTYGWFFEAMTEKAFHDCHFGLHEREVQSFWGHQAKEAYQLDHFFADRGSAGRVRACDVITTDDTRRMSDHSPVLLEVA
jgi:endonuclease/exonuclease/phosphatase family metal-dependent hydrolase